jgi:hypothetical protein
MSIIHKVLGTTARVLSFAAVLGLLGGLGSALLVVEPAGAAITTLFVSASGSDTNRCTPTAPCATISHAASIAGRGAIIKVAGRIFDSVVVSKKLTIEHWPGLTPAVIDGAGHTTSATIVNNGILTLHRLTVTGGVAGGVVNNARLTITNCTITGNTVTGAIYFAAGGVSNEEFGTLTITDSTITGNTGGSSSTSVGGGVVNDGSAAITDSTISGNTVPIGGDFGVAAGGFLNLASATITDSTITSNTVAGPSFYGAGGGVHNAGSLTIDESTITGNTVTGNVSGNSAGVFSLSPAAIGATIVAGNTSDGSASNCVGEIASLGYDLADDATCPFSLMASPDLGPLAFNGGPTETQLPARNSPAVGVIPSPTTLNGVPVCGPGAFDQRGVPRPSPGPNCTVGAVERRG